MSKINTKAIFKITTAARLLELGNSIVRIGRNQHDSSKAVFYFAATSKLYRDLKWIEENN